MKIVTIPIIRSLQRIAISALERQNQSLVIMIISYEIAEMSWMRHFALNVKMYINESTSLAAMDVIMPKIVLIVVIAYE